MVQAILATVTLAMTLSVSGLSTEGPAATGPGVSDASSVTLDYRTYRKWDILLPSEEMKPVGDGFDLPISAHKKYIAKLDGTALAIDTDGDGETDVRADGDSALVTLRGKTDAGAKFTYAMRLDSKRGWRFAPAGAMVGKIESTKIQIIDQNNNGRYDDYGVDAMVVGRGRAASFLSKTVRVDDALYSIDVTTDGSKLDFTPYAGKTGGLNVTDKLDTKAKIASVVVRSADGNHSFELSRAKGDVQVPAGTYVLQSGRIGLGQVTVSMRTGRAKPFSVEAGNTTQVAWGGPINVEFDYGRQGGNVSFSPAAVWYYGSAGEEYHDWSPPGKSPQFVIKDAKEGRELVVAKFGGC